MAQKSQVSFSFLDASNETSTVQFLVPTISDALTSDDYSDVWTEARALRAAIEAVTLGTTVKTVVQGIEFNAPVPPTDKTAQRESKWLVTYVDNEPEFAVGVPNPGYGRRFTAELPCANLELLGPTGSPSSSILDITTGVGLALKNAIENLVLAASGGNVVVLRVEHVGRNT